MIAVNATFPIFVASDIDAQKHFYINHFGFESVFFDADFYLHLVRPRCGAELGFLMPDLPSQPEFLHPAAGTQGMVISFEVANTEIAF